jgi:hypothetical protein
LYNSIADAARDAMEVGVVTFLDKIMF